MRPSKQSLSGLTLKAKYFDGVEHHNLCTEVLLNEICQDLTMLLLSLGK